MKANIYNSLFNSDSSKPWQIPRYTCSSGNCTWDPITTLEMRASCTNIRDRLKTNCDNSIEGMRLNSSMQICSVYLQDSSSNISAYVLRPGEFWGAPVAIGSLNPFIYNNSILPPIQLVAPDNLPPFEELWSLETPIQPEWQAIECSIDPVVRSFRPTVRRGGVYHEETLGISKNGSFENLVMGSNYHMHPSWGPNMGVDKNKKILIYKRTLMAIQYFFQLFFAGRAQLNYFNFEYSAGPAGVYASADLMQLIALSNITGCAGGTTKQMHCAMDNVAAAMSKTIRDTPSSFDFANTTGQAMTSMTHVSIHWQWIILPVVVWLLGLVTLLGTIWKTRKAAIPTWKNNTIPLLGVYKNGQNEKPQSDEVSVTERVTLYQIEGKLVLSG